MTGPAAQVRGQDAAVGAVVVEEVQDLVEDVGHAGGDLVARRAIWGGVTLATVASFDNSDCISETRRLWGAGSVDISVEILWTRAVFVQWAEWPRGRRSATH